MTTQLIHSGIPQTPLGQVVDFALRPLEMGGHQMTFRIVDDLQVDQSFNAAFKILPHDRYIDDGSGEFVYIPEEAHGLLNGPRMVVDRLDDKSPSIIQIQYYTQDDRKGSGELAGFLRVAELLEKSNAIGFIERLKLQADIRAGLAVNAGKLQKPAAAPADVPQLVHLRLQDGNDQYTIFIALTDGERRKNDEDLREGLELFSSRIVHVERTFCPSARSMQKTLDLFVRLHPSSPL